MLFENNKFIFKFDLISSLDKKYTKFDIPNETSENIEQITKAAS